MSGKDVDAVKAIQQPPREGKAYYNAKDVLLYACGIGAVAPQFSYEGHESFAPFPTMAVTWNGAPHDIVDFATMMGGGIGIDGGLGSKKKDTGIPKFNPNLLLHGEQYLELLGGAGAALPRAAALRSETKLIGVHDKGGKAALLESETAHFDARTGAPLAVAVSGLFVRGMGGFEGAGRTMSKTLKRPARAPDATAELCTLPQQALLYRLSGDYNPLHADDRIAQSVGFERGAILHGLCTFSHAARAVLDAFGGADAARFKAIKVRFAAPAYPGETFVAHMWALPAGTAPNGCQRVQVELKVKERDIVVINSAYVDLYPPSSKL